MRLSSAGSARDRRILRIQSRRISIRRENTRQATQLPGIIKLIQKSVVFVFKIKEIFKYLFELNILVAVRDM